MGVSVSCSGTQQQVEKCCRVEGLRITQKSIIQVRQLIRSHSDKK